MGLLDNTLQRESKNVVMSNCCNFEGKLGRLAMENDHHDACGGLPKYKRRSISAVRDFPNGCGRHAPRISLELEDKTVTMGIVENSGDLARNGVAEGDCLILSSSRTDSQPPLESLVPTTIPGDTNHSESKAEDHLIPLGNGNESQPARSFENLPSAVIPKQLDHLKSKVEAQAIQSPVDIEPVKVSCNTGDIEPLISLEPLIAANILHKKGAPTSRNQIFPQKYPPRRKVSAVRDFPPFCGRNAPPLIHGSTNTFACTDGKSLGQELMNKEDAQVGQDVPKKMDDNIQTGHDHKLQLDTEVWTMVEFNTDPESEAQNAKDRRYQNKVGGSSNNEMVIIRQDVSEQSIKSCQETVQNLQELRTQEIPRSGRSSIEISEDIGGLDIGSNRPLVLCLMAAGTDPWMDEKKANKRNELTGITSESKRTNDLILQERPKVFLKAKKNVENSGGVRVKEKKKKIPSTGGQVDQFMDNIALDVEDKIEQNVDVTLPPRPIRSSVKSDGNDAGVTRSKVRETLRLFQAVYRKIVKEDETKSKNIKRPDFVAAGILKNKGKYINKNKIIGSVPGVEVGDEFQYRVELNIIGLHRQVQGGIDFVKDNGRIIATSIVASGGYDDNMDDSDVLVYTGSGGNMMNGKKEPEDQKLERGNLALKNSAEDKNPVRVIRGDMRASESSSAKTRTYIYDGLYFVEKYWQELGPHNKLIFKFKLVRLPGQPELAWKVVKKCKKFKVREGLCMDDISMGKEIIPICAVNTIDEEKPPQFEYVTRVIYPDGFIPVPSRCCDCTSGCSETGKCSCVAKNGGEIPYNRNGAIVQAKTLVYECGPSCKCPPSCTNKVSQHGIKFQLEIFKTESRGWGVRSLNSISSGSFICEYVGELLEDKEAEERKGNDEYLFDIGNSQSDNSLWDGLSNLISETHQSSCKILEESGFTIDAAKYGNVGRFINHSCSPNLYAQNVLYDHEDRRVPHIMLFAAEHIPPLQELTYHYNYTIDQVIDTDGNIKRKICCCGSSECTGRLY